MKSKLKILIESLHAIQAKQKRNVSTGVPESDLEDDHKNADTLLLQYVDSENVTEAFNSIDKWYS